MTSINAASPAIASNVDRYAGFDAGAIINYNFDDFEEMAAAAPKWNQEYFKLGGGNAGGSFEVSQTARMQLGRIVYRTGLLAQGLIPSHAVAFLAHSDGAPMTHHGHRLSAGEIAVLTDGSEFECFAHGPLQVLALSMDESYLRDQFRALAHVDDFPSPSVGTCIRLNEFGHGKLLDTIGRMVGVTLSKPQLLTHPIAAKRMEDEIASLLVSAMVARSETEAPWVRHRAAKRALDYIRANAEQLFTISDLCVAIGASQRTLEIGFQELFGMAPKAYLTLLRLNRVRRALRARDRSRTSVTDIATHWGFYHFGRFAAAYRENFGELPSATLNAGKSVAPIRLAEDKVRFFARVPR